MCLPSHPVFTRWRPPPWPRAAMWLALVLASAARASAQPPSPQPPPPATPVALASRWSVLPEALPVNELLAEGGERLALLVVVIPFDDGESVTLAGELAPALVTRLETLRRVESAQRVRKAADLYMLPDADVARRLLAADQNADAVVVARLYPGASPDEPPRVVLSLVDADGKTWATRASVSAVAPRQQAVSKGVERVFREGRGNADADEPPDGGERPSRGEKLAAFRERALMWARVNGAMVIRRQGATLDARELRRLGAPQPAEGRPSSTYVKTGVFLVPFLVFAGGPPLACVSLMALAVVVGAVVGIVQGNAFVAAVGGLAAWPYIVVACVVAGVLGFIPALVGLGGALYFYFPEPPHSYVPFVRSHNRKVAQALKLDPRDVPQGYPI